MKKLWAQGSSVWEDGKADKELKIKPSSSSSTFEHLQVDSFVCKAWVGEHSAKLQQAVVWTLFLARTALPAIPNQLPFLLY